MGVVKRYTIYLADKNGLLLEIFRRNDNIVLCQKMPVVNEDNQIIDFEIYNAIVIPEDFLDEVIEKLKQIKKERDGRG